MSFQKLISYTFHPILIPIIGCLLFFMLSPQVLAPKIELLILLMVFTTTYIIPILLLAFLRKKNVISSFKLINIKERKLPLLILLFTTLFIAQVLRSINTTLLLSSFFYGMSFSIIVTYFLINKQFKISIHATSTSGLLAFFVLFSSYYQINIIPLLIIISLFSGIIATSRLKLDAHNKKEIYWGIILGISSEVVAYLIVL